MASTDETAPTETAPATTDEQAQQGGDPNQAYAQYPQGMTEEQQRAYEQYYQQYYSYYYPGYYQQQAQQGAEGQTATADGTNPPADGATAATQTQPMMDPASYYAQYAYAYPQSYAYPTHSYPSHSYHGPSTSSSRSGGEPARTLWIGNTPDDTKESDITELFGRFGAIESVKLLPAKNCAFVRFVDLDSSIQAHSQMQGGHIRGHPFKLGWGKAETNVLNKEEALASNSGPPPCRNIWLGNLPSDFTEQEIHDMLSQYGSIEKIRILPAKNCAFITFTTLDSAINAKHSLLGTMVHDRPVKINFGKDTQDLFDNSPHPKPTRLSSPPAVKGPLIPPPPPNGPPPTEEEQKKVIDKMAEYVMRNGAVWEEMMQNKQKGVPKFGFLFEGHEHYLYYKRKLWCLRYPEVDPETYDPANYLPEPKQSDVSPGQSPYRQQPPGGMYSAVPPPPSLGSSTHAPPSSSYRQPEDPMQKLNQLVDGLVSTKESIKEVKTWVMDNNQLIDQIVRHLRMRMDQARDFEKRLSILYLIHDVLHHSKRDRDSSQTSDMYSEAFEPYLGSILRACAQNQSSENVEKIAKVVRIWEDKQIYDPNRVRQFEQELHSKQQSHGYDERSSHHDRKRRDRDDHSSYDRDRPEKHSRH